MTEGMWRARELLAAEYQRDGMLIATRRIRGGQVNRPTGSKQALRAITAALRAAPEGFVMVPVEPTVEALTAMSVAIGMEPLTPPNDEGSYPITGSQSTIRRCYDALVLAARPQEGSDA